VYSDLDRRSEDTASNGKKLQNDEKNPVEGDFSPDGSTKTVSSHSEQSQVKESSPAFTAVTQQAVSESIRDLPTELLITNENDMKKQQALMVVNAMTVSVEPMESSVDKATHTTEVTAPETTTDIIRSPTTASGSAFHSSSGGKSSKDESHPQLKKYKMPKRNVVSKVRAMIESSSHASGGSPNTEDDNQENRRPTRSPSKSLRKNGSRWDTVMNKIAQGQAEQKLKPRSLKEVKSKVLANMTPSAAQQGDGASHRSTERTRKGISSNFGPSASSRTLKENSPLKVKR